MIGRRGIVVLERFGLLASAGTSAICVQLGQLLSRGRVFVPKFPSKVFKKKKFPSKGQTQNCSYQRFQKWTQPKIQRPRETKDCIQTNMSELLIHSLKYREDVDLYLELFSNICPRVVCGYNYTSYKKFVLQSLKGTYISFEN
jgi:hypothetical protein